MSAAAEIVLPAWVLDPGVRIVAVVVAAVLLSLVARMAVRRMERRLERSESLTKEYNLKRVATVTHALSYTFQVAIWTVAVLLVLGEAGVNLGPLLAGAGIAGVALGFGAQSLVRDFLSGFFIILENQFGVGDLVDVRGTGGTVTGKVETLSLRTTAVRAFDGTLHFVPNGNIQLVGNRSRGWARAIVDIGVAYGEDIERVRGVLEDLFEELRSDDELKGGFFSGPEVLGVERFTDYEVVVRVAAETRPSQRIAIERELRKRIKERFDEHGIEIPFPHRVMISRQETPPADES